MDNPLGRLKAKLDMSKRQRDDMQRKVMSERAAVAQREAVLAQKQAECHAAKSRLQEQEEILARFEDTMRESEIAYNKLMSNTEKLLSALDQESAQLSKFMK